MSDETEAIRRQQLVGDQRPARQPGSLGSRARAGVGHASN